MTAMTGKYLYYCSGTRHLLYYFGVQIHPPEIIEPNWYALGNGNLWHINFSDSGTDDDEGDGEAELLESDEDEIDEDGAQYLEKLEKHINTQSNGTIEVKYLN